MSKLGKASIELLLDACQGNWHCIEERLKSISFQKEYFHLLAGLALARGQIDIIR
jgi:hypothetical protein